MPTSVIVLNTANTLLRTRSKARGLSDTATVEILTKRDEDWRSDRAAFIKGARENDIDLHRMM